MMSASMLWFTTYRPIATKATPIKAVEKNLSVFFIDSLRSGECSCVCQQRSSKFVSGRTRKSIPRTIKSRCKKRGYDMDVDADSLSRLLQEQQHRCALSHLPISVEDGTASVDRIDNSLGYVCGNVQWVHRHINYMKTELDQDEFISLCSHVASAQLSNDECPADRCRELED